MGSRGEFGGGDEEDFVVFGFEHFGDLWGGIGGSGGGGESGVAEGPGGSEGHAFWGEGFAVEGEGGVGVGGVGDGHQEDDIGFKEGAIGRVEDDGRVLGVGGGGEDARQGDSDWDGGEGGEPA